MPTIAINTAMDKLAEYQIFRKKFTVRAKERGTIFESEIFTGLQYREAVRIARDLVDREYPIVELFHENSVRRNGEPGWTPWYTWKDGHRIDH